MKYAIAIALLGVTTVTASPYYVGENLQPKNNITLGFTDTPSKKGGSRTSTGNIAAIELKGSYSPAQKAAVRIDLPIYMANKNAVGTSSRTAMGNLGLGGVWTETITSANQSSTYGYALAADAWLPTSRKVEADTVARANPTTDLYKYTSKAWALTPTFGGFISQDRWSAKTNIGGAYGYFVKSAPSRNSKANHLALTWQTAASWHALSNLHVNAEYNTIYMDGATNNGNNKAWKHAVTPSVSGNYDKLVASAYATIPLDKTTRNYTNVAFGLNAGYTF